MTKITFLGTSSAIPDIGHENTHLVVESGKRVVLIDCTGNPVVRLRQAGIKPEAITDLILTHFHPDHVSGVPLLLMDLWLMGRKQPLEIYALADVVDRVQKMLALFDWHEWDGFYPVNFHKVPDDALTLLFGYRDIQAWAAPVCHMIPGIGLKMSFPDGKLCYSSDTAPCDTVIQMAKDVDILIHEATGEGTGHSSPAQAGEIAQQAGVKKLFLIHYPPESDPGQLWSEAKITFKGEVVVAKDLMSVTFT